MDGLLSPASRRSGLGPLQANLHAQTGERTVSQETAVPQVDTKDIDELCVNTIRTLAMDAVQKANSGHPGTPMALAPLAYVLWTQFLRYDPREPKWPDRDRFILSNGHACMLQYAVLHLTGYDLSLDDIKQFRQWDSRTPGHPEHLRTPGVETTTGPLGQGIMNSVGMAMAERIWPRSSTGLNTRSSIIAPTHSAVTGT